MKKETRKWCEFHNIPWHNIDECCSKQSLLAKLKVSQLNTSFDSKLDLENGKLIIDAKPSATIATNKVQPSEPKDSEEGGHLVTHSCG